MEKSAKHIKRIKVISNTHWDREFRWSFEKTRRRLLDMMDITLDILEKNPKFHSFTLDGHAILIDDYLEMRPEKRPLVEKFIREGRLVAGPWYTLAEEFSISHEALLRNFLWGRKTVEKYGGSQGAVAYTPSSWGQTGQLPQILLGFGIDKMMFYRGISHHESDAEYVWSAPDGSRVLATRFAIYARYNWYYQVHRPVTRGRVFEKDFTWAQWNDVPFRFIDGLSDTDAHFNLLSPEMPYDKSRLKKSIQDMVEREGSHFTTSMFLAMNGHDISVPYPLEPQVIEDAKKIFKGKYSIEHTDLETYWKELVKLLDMKKLPVLSGERRAALKQGMWTYLFPSTISARTYLKQQDFNASTNLVYLAEPLASLSSLLGAEYPSKYLDRAWQYLLSNHTHDANGGCAPDAVCTDMEYRYRKTSDIADIVAEDSIGHIARNLLPKGLDKDIMQVVVFNPLPFKRDVTMSLDLEVPSSFKSKFIRLESPDGKIAALQPVFDEKSSVFVDNLWEVPSILSTNRYSVHASFKDIPALGYRTYLIKQENDVPRNPATLVTGPDSMENAHVKVKVNSNGTVDILNKKTGKTFSNLNYLTDQGECGNAWMHRAPRFDRIYNSLSVKASLAVTESGPLVSKITAEFEFPVPADYADGKSRSMTMKNIPVRIEYILRKDSSRLDVNLTLDNIAKDHWLRASFPTGLKTDRTWADSHYDVVSRQIELPDSTGWVEPAWGAHPLRTFVAMSDGKDGIAVMPKGLFEYEALNDSDRTLLLTLIRACRIKLAVSEEKMTELPDMGIQCPGFHKFEYSIDVHKGDWKNANIISKAAEYYTPARIVMTGRGKGKLELEASLFSMDNPKLHVSCIKKAEKGDATIIRLFNPLEEKQQVTIKAGIDISSAVLCRPDETETGNAILKGRTIHLEVPGKKILTVKISRK
ncbi:MAG TPA: hypothetical protein DCZ94_07345 [Lentisphaeria bacterium]|nr:MAG: hypothetical protein A2X48_20490 [Lentisphaerae bacterium GWF2_49_21]HBC86750.1 hypothetical protein [Lentisphaeria bacterium]